MFHALVTFDRIIVNSAGDLDGWGQIYFELRVNGVVVDRREVYNPITVMSTSHIDIGKTIDIELADQETEFQISGRISEIDWLSNDHVTFAQASRVDWNRNDATPQIESASMKDSDDPLLDGILNVDVVWTVDGYTTGDLGEVDFGHIADTDPRISGIVAYEDWRFNERRAARPAGDGHPQLRSSPAQTFPEGEFNLPHPIEVNFHGGASLIPGIAADAISSVKVGKGYFVELFKEHDWRGTPLVLQETTREMPDGWNDVVKSMRVKLRPIVLPR